ncbi:unnamed protein product [marine sediment metagenome]|uniref:Uncharacterized protein n=1 Tax=marine sediment metagenome TaxID=412755 RepID=X1E9S4_9ZZZZ
MRKKGNGKNGAYHILHFVYDKINDACQYAEIECQSSQYQEHVIRPLSVLLLETENKLNEIEKGTVNSSKVNKKDHLLELLVSLGKHILKIAKLFEDYEKMMDEDDPDDDIESFEICSVLVWEGGTEDVH